MRTSDGKRHRSTQEWLNAQGDDPIQKFRIINVEEDKVLEGYKNTKTKQRLLTKVRRPTTAEVLSANTKAFTQQKTRPAKELIDREW